MYKNDSSKKTRKDKNTIFVEIQFCIKKTQTSLDLVFEVEMEHLIIQIHILSIGNCAFFCLLYVSKFIRSIGVTNED